MDRPYEGSSPRLIVSFDVGNRFTKVAYCILRPGLVPKIKAVRSEENVRDVKMCSAVYYDRRGYLKIAGHSPSSFCVQDMLGDPKAFYKADMIKLHMFPNSLPQILSEDRLPPLPRKKRASEAYADLLDYLWIYSSCYIVENDAESILALEDFIEDVNFVITHPESPGFDGEELLRAAVLGRLVPDLSSGRERILMFSEERACIYSALHEFERLIPQNNVGTVLVANLGGETCSFAAFKVRNGEKIEIKSLSSRTAVLDGSFLITLRAKAEIERKFAEKDRYREEWLTHSLEHFQNTIRPTFAGANGFSGHNIECEGISFTPQEIENLFEPTINSIVTELQRHLRDSPVTISTTILSGGLASNPYVHSQIERNLGSTVNSRLNIIRMLNPSAVAIGGIFAYIEKEFADLPCLE